MARLSRYREAEYSDWRKGNDPEIRRKDAEVYAEP